MTTKHTTPQQLWGTEFDKQYTHEMLCDLEKRASALVKRYERYLPRKSTDTIDDRIQTAIMKLMDKKRKWDPSRVDLCGFLHGIIASDLSGELFHAKLMPLVCFDARKAAREDDYTGEPCDESSIECRASIENGTLVPLTPASDKDAWAVAMDYLHKLAGDDQLVLSLLGAYEEGVTLKKDVMKLLNWSARKYDKAYARLLALGRSADPDVRELILAGLAN